MREKYLDSKGLPTPRTRRYITFGEWDSKDNLIIKFMMKENFWGRIGTAGGASDGADSFVEIRVAQLIFIRNHL